MREEVQVPEVIVTEFENTALRREQQNVGTRNAQRYGHEGFGSLPFTSEQAQWFALVGEYASHLYFGVDPYGTQWVVNRSDYERVGLKHNADLKVTDAAGTEWKIEVRNCTGPWSPLPINAKDNQPNLIVVQVYVEPDAVNEKGGPVRGEAVPTGRVVFLGWRYGTDYRAANAKNGVDYRAFKYGMDSLGEVLVRVAA